MYDTSLPTPKRLGTGVKTCTVLEGQQQDEEESVENTEAEPNSKPTGDPFARPLHACDFVSSNTPWGVNKIVYGIRRDAAGVPQLLPVFDDRYYPQRPAKSSHDYRGSTGNI